MSDKKKGNFTALERRHIIEALFAGGAEVDQADHERSFDVAEALGLTDEMFKMKLRGSLPPLAPVPVVPEGATPQTVDRLQREFDDACETASAELDRFDIPFEVTKADLDHVLKMLGHTKWRMLSSRIVAARIGKKCRAAIEGSTPPE